MQPRVTAVLVARNGAAHLGRTLEALTHQSRPVDALLVVDAGSTDGTAGLLSDTSADVRVTAGAVPYGEAVAAGIRALPPTSSADEWLWLLNADTSPAPDALAALLAAVEIAPSVAIAGPKLVAVDDPRTLRSYGVSVSVTGRTVPLLDSELDQAQYDAETDVLAVDLPGALVRRSVWEALGGADPGLPSTDAGLDLAIRARLAGHRVVRVPAARVGVDSRPEDFGRARPAGPRLRRRLGRSAQLHRRFVYSAGILLPLIWLSLVPLAIGRSVVHLLAKRPGAVPGEFAAAFRAAFADPTVPAARRRLRRGRSIGWAAVAPLRIDPADLRRRRASERERAAEGRADAAPLVRAEFFSGGGVWVVVGAGLLGLVAWWRLLGAAALEGGAAQPLAPTVAQLWDSALGVRRTLGTGGDVPADPFASVLAVIGSISFPAPSVSVVVLWLLALPLAALGGWWLATRFSPRAWPPIVAGIVWALAPPLLSSLAEGRVAAVIAHLALPWLVLAAYEGRRSWSAAGAASLLFAVVVACSPALAPALLVAAIAWAAARPRALPRLLGIPLPAVALFLPIVLAQLAAGRPLALVADPGPVTGFVVPGGWALALGEPRADALGWASLSSALGVGGASGGIAVAVLLAPLAALALLALFLPGSRRAIAPLVLALLGLLTAAIAVHLRLTATGPETVAVWPAPALSLYLLGLLCAAVLGLRALGRTAVPAGALLALAVIALAVPSIAAGVLGRTPATAGDGTTLPAIVTARAADDPRTTTLVLTARQDGSLSARLVHGAGETLDQQSTVLATQPPSAAERRLDRVAGNLASQSGREPGPGLDRFGIRYVLLAPAAKDASDAASSVRARAQEGLDSDATLSPVSTTPLGTLWQYPGLKAAPAARPGPDPLHGALLLVQAIVIGAALLLAIPTSRRRRVVTEEDPLEDPGNTFGEDDDE